MPHHYQKVYQDLKSQIQSGEYAIGDYLPTEKMLCEKYSIARVTVRQALNELVKEQLVTRIQGKGSVVQPPRPTLALLSIKGFSEAVGKENRKVTNIFLKPPSVSNFPKPFFYPLTDAEQTHSCLYIERIRLTDETPVMLEFTYVPLDQIQDFDRSGLINNSLFKTLEEKYKIEIVGLEQDLRALEADEDTAFLLKIKHQSPVLHIYRRYRTNVPFLFIYSSLFCATDKFAIGSAW